MIEDYFTEIESMLIASPIVASFKSSKMRLIQIMCIPEKVFIHTRI